MVAPNAGRAPLPEQVEQTRDLDETIVMPANGWHGSVESPVAVPYPAQRRRRRPTALNMLQLAAAGVLFLVLAFVCATGIWLAAAGRSAAVAAPLSELFLGIFDHFGAFQLALAALAALLGATNATIMRVAVYGDYNMPLATYRRLRLNHRFIGYSTALIAIALYVMTWTAVLGLGAPAGRGAVALMLGSAVLVVAVSKIAVVRYIASLRRYLAYFGVTLLVLLLGVLAATIAVVA
jgi:hypothetical protein